MTPVYYTIVDYGCTPQSEFNRTQAFNFTLHEIQRVDGSILGTYPQPSEEDTDKVTSDFLESVAERILNLSPHLREIRFEELRIRRFDKIAQRLVMEMADPKIINPDFIIANHQSFFCTEGITQLVFFFRSIAEGGIVNIVLKLPQKSYGEGNYFFSFALNDIAEFISHIQSSEWASKLYASSRLFFLIEKQVGYHKKSKYVSHFGSDPTYLSHRAILFYYLVDGEVQFTHIPVFKRYRKNINSHETANLPWLTKQYLMCAKLSNGHDEQEVEEPMDMKTFAKDRHQPLYYQKLKVHLYAIAKALYEFKNDHLKVNMSHKIWVAHQCTQFKYTLDARHIISNCHCFRPQSREFLALSCLLKVILDKIPNESQWDLIRKHATQIITYALLYPMDARLLQAFYFAIVEYATKISADCLINVKAEANSYSDINYVRAAIRHIERNPDFEVGGQYIGTLPFFSKQSNANSFLTSCITD